MQSLHADSLKLLINIVWLAAYFESFRSELFPFSSGYTMMHLFTFTLWLETCKAAAGN